MIIPFPRGIVRHDFNLLAFAVAGLFNSSAVTFPIAFDYRHSINKKWAVSSYILSPFYFFPFAFAFDGRASDMKGTAKDDVGLK